MKPENPKQLWLLAALGIVPVIWLALLIAPHINQGLLGIFNSLDQPFHITWHEDSLRVVLVLVLAYALAVGMYLSSRKNYRRREEHGSAKWGMAGTVNKKYADPSFTQNKLFTQHVRMGLDGHKHRRNLNVLICGGSGAGKTRFYCKPNILQANTSFVCLDPKGGATRS